MHVGKVGLEILHALLPLEDAILQIHPEPSHLSLQLEECLLPSMVIPKEVEFEHVQCFFAAVHDVFFAGGLFPLRGILLCLCCLTPCNNALTHNTLTLDVGLKSAGIKAFNFVVNSDSAETLSNPVWGLIDNWNPVDICLLQVPKHFVLCFPFKTCNSQSILASRITIG